MAKKKNNNQQTFQSKTWLVNSLLQLMQDKPFQRITIQEIANKAELDRRTFYRHFATKESLLDYYIYELIKPYIEQMDKETLQDDYLLTYNHFNFLKQHVPLLKLLKRHQLFDRLLPVYNQSIRLFGEEFGLLVDTPSAPYTIAFKAGGGGVGMPFLYG